MSSVPPQEPFKEPRQQRKADRGYVLASGLSLATVLQRFRQVLVPWQTQRTKDEKCKLTKLVIRIASGFRLKRVSRIDYVLLMVNGEHSSPVHLHFNGRLVAARKPKAINFLVLPDKVGSIDPEGWLLGGMAGDFHNREVFGIDPNFPLEQVLVFAFRSGFENEAMKRTNFLLTE